MCCGLEKGVQGGLVRWMRTLYRGNAVYERGGRDVEIGRQICGLDNWSQG